MHLKGGGHPMYSGSIHRNNPKQATNKNGLHKQGKSNHNKEHLSSDCIDQLQTDEYQAY